MQLQFAHIVATVQAKISGVSRQQYYLGVLLGEIELDLTEGAPNWQLLKAKVAALRAVDTAAVAEMSMLKNFLDREVRDILPTGNNQSVTH